MTPSELDEIATLLTAAWRAYGPKTYFHLGDVCWRLRDPAWEERLRLWRSPGGDLAAFGTLDPPGDFELQIHPAHSGRSLEAEILAWGEAQAEKGAGDAAGKPAPATWASEADADWIELLSTRGYRRTDDICAHLLHDLKAVPTAEPPHGFAIRSVKMPDEISPRVAVHRAAFSPSPLTAERYARLVALPFYRAGLDVVAVAPDGTFAAFCLCWFELQSRTGLLEPVGTAPEFRGLGLGRAVVLGGLRRLREAGCERVAVVTGDDNAGAMRLYESCGFRVDRKDHRYQRH